ncbi:NlpC/P60 family protein [Corynebacterium frankenforstense]|uniref:DIP1281 family NlpC/P60 protein n=1 Tax=Corynebacterium frankenforstense TaxID=1230998 RepID=UPI0025517530|nr:NlpC/P60 family protein [Corynebacterium frankenforstense]MDK6260097.1 NlpC/P60 family protein [Corynebacterium frankenforstense]
MAYSLNADQTQTPTRAGRRVGACARVAVATTVSAVMVATSAVAGAVPRNPEPSEFAQAQQAVDAGAGGVAEAAGALSSKEEEIANLELDMGGVREQINKTLVDLHDAQGSAEQARQAVKEARAELDQVQDEMSSAQDKLDEISRTAYRRGASAPVSGVSGNATSEDGLDRRTYLRTNAEKQRAAVDELDRLRTETANRESRLREARDVAEDREAAAEKAQNDARAQIDERSRELEEKNAEREQLVAQRDEAQGQLDAARGHHDSLDREREEYREYEQREQERKEAEEKAREAAAAKAKAEREEAAAEEQERARKEAEDAAQREREATAAAEKAAEAVAATQPEHNTLDNPYPTGEDADAGEIAAVQNPSGTAATGESTSTEATETSATAQATATSETATSTQAAESTQSTATAPAEPTATATTEAAEETATTTESTDSTGQSIGGPTLETADEVSEEVSGSVDGSREQRIETVIARAKSQIGMPYAWGGGDANGPTKGIRDGGVADSYGDYNKIGFDCSGLVLYAFAGVGISLPHYTGYQYQRGTKVDPSNMERGDLIFYGPAGNHHVAIYLGDGQMIEAPQSGSTVQISPVRWSGMSASAVRLI